MRRSAAAAAVLLLCGTAAGQRRAASGLQETPVAPMGDGADTGAATAGDATFSCMHDCRTDNDGWGRFGCYKEGMEDEGNTMYCSSSDAGGHWCSETQTDHGDEVAQPGRCGSCGGMWCKPFKAAKNTPAPPWTPPPVPAPPGSCEDAATEDECKTTGDKPGSCTWLAGTKHCKKKCDKNHYGEDCTVYCDPVSTCKTHGKCGSKGTCLCEPGWEGPSCNQKLKDSCHCSAWGDPHYTDWAGWKWDFMGTEAYEIYGSKGFHVTAEHEPCDATTNAKYAGTMCQGRVNLWHEGWGDTSVEIDKKGHLYINCAEPAACPPTYGMIREAGNSWDTWGVEHSCANNEADITQQLGALTPPLKVKKLQPAHDEWGASEYSFEVGDMEAELDVNAPSGKYAVDVYVKHYGKCSSYQGAQGWGGVETRPEGVSGLCNGPKDPLVKDCYKGPKDLQPSTCGALLGDSKKMTRLCKYTPKPGPPPTPPPPVPVPPNEPPPPATPPPTAWPTKAQPPETPMPPTPPPTVAPTVPGPHCPAECTKHHCNVECEGKPKPPPRECSETDITADMRKFEGCCAKFGGGCASTKSSGGDATEMSFYVQCLYENCILGDPYVDEDSIADADDEPLECLETVQRAAENDLECPCEGHYRFDPATKKCALPNSGDCESDWFGETCAQQCLAETCGANGVCGADGSCVCNEFWEGELCEKGPGPAPDTPAPPTDGTPTTPTDPTDSTPTTKKPTTASPTPPPGNPTNYPKAPPAHAEEPEEFEPTSIQVFGECEVEMGECEFSTALKSDKPAKKPDSCVQDEEGDCEDGRVMVVDKAADCGQLQSSDHIGPEAGVPAFVTDDETRVAEFTVTEGEGIRKMAEENYQVCYKPEGGEPKPAPQCDNAADDPNKWCDRFAAPKPETASPSENGSGVGKALAIAAVAAVVAGVVALGVLTALGKGPLAKGKGGKGKGSEGRGEGDYQPADEGGDELGNRDAWEKKAKGRPEPV